MNVITPELRERLLADDTDAVRDALAAAHPADAANEIAGMPVREAARLLTLMPGHRQGAVFGYFEPDLQIEIAKALPRPALAAVITVMSHDERADVFRRLDDRQKSTLLPALAQAEREDIRRLAGYAEGTAGSVMTSDYATLSLSMTAREAIDALRKEAPDAETIYNAYVVDADRLLLGVVTLRDLVLADEGTPVEALMNRDFIAARADEQAEAVARRIGEYDLMAIPVLSEGGRIVGIVTADDALDIIEEETTDTMLQKAGLTTFPASEEHIRSERLVNGPLFYPVRVRLMFLIVTLIGGLIVGGLVETFEDVLEAVVATAVFIPLIMDMGGNVGTQSTTIFARGYALGQIRFEHYSRVLWRELRVGAILGLIIGVLAGIVAWWWQGAPNGIPQLGVAVGVSLFVTITLAAVLGFILPYVMVKIGVDHAPGADPFVTTIKDFTGLLVYFLLVGWLLGVDMG